MARHRVEKDLKEMRKHPEFSAGPPGEDLFEWNAVIHGPADSPYSGGTFNLRNRFFSEYPFKAPRVIFKTQIYHPNISMDGQIQLVSLGDAWDPKITAHKILESISTLLSEPDWSDPLVPEVAELYGTDPEQFRLKAEEWTRAYATA